MTNVIMLVKNRYRLTRQAVDSLRQNTPTDQYTLTVVDDNSTDFRVRNLLDNLPLTCRNCTVLHVSNSGHVLAQLRNLGTSWAFQKFGESDYACYVDNDVYFLPGWLERMKKALWAVDILGGQRHPYHQVTETVEVAPDESVEIVHAVAGYTHFMAESITPYSSSCAPGIGQSEDVEICKDRRVGYIYPPAVLHCGITNSDGKPATGAEAFERYPGVIYE